ncbi:MAG: flagellar biosynthesis anti-sigma factor FlgM [Chloroflexota bacterium]
MNDNIKARLFAVYLLNLCDYDVPMGQIVEAVKEMPDLRCNRIEEIRRRIETGTYQINIEQLTEDLLLYLNQSTR